MTPDAPERPATADPHLWNPDLAATTPSQRTWNKWHIAALWVGMAICIPTYTLAAGLLSQGMGWVAAISLVLVGNLIVLVPMVLNAHPGAKYGVPFPVLARASFGVRGANIPAVLRALVACGWFGIQTWLGGQAIYELLRALIPAIGGAPHLGDFFGINLAELLSFLGFWALNMYFVVRGMDAIRFFESWSAPLLIAVGLALLAWAFSAGGGPSRVLEASEQFTRPTVSAKLEAGEAAAVLTPVVVDGTPKAAEVRFAKVTSDADANTVGTALEATSWRPLEKVVPLGAAAEGDRFVFQFKADTTLSSRVELRVPAEGTPPSGLGLGQILVGLTAMVGFWATLSLNIPDFTRFARSQRDQLVGQAIGLPPAMALYSFIGVAVTAASLLAFPDILVQADAPWDPVKLIARFESPALVVLAMFALAVATLTTNIAANVVSPANDFANLAPDRISFKMGGLITGVLGLVMMPWKLLASVGDYLFVWLVGYSALLGPIGGIMIADYFMVRKTELDLEGLYRADGPYAYRNGIHWRSIAILIIAVLPNLPGFLAAAGIVDKLTIPTLFHELYNYAWFVGFGLGFFLYWAWGQPRNFRAARDRS
jgi:cytosine/uracil/thiamine/allantoin permease